MVKIKKHLFLASSAAALALAACAPPENQMLNQARAAYSVARNDPQIIQKAPLELNQAAETLQGAESLYEQKADERNVTHQAYLANQKIAIAREAAQLKLTEEAIANAGMQRQQVLLQARSREAEKGKQEAARTQQELAQAQAQLSEAEKARQGEMTQQQAQMREKEIAALRQQIREAEMRPTPSGIALSLKEVVFPVDKAELNPGGERAIAKIAEFLKQHPDRIVVVEGFTDSTGSPSHNRQLSDARAEAVRHALVLHGVEEKRITAKGFGEEYPVASNDTPAGRQLNRRVEVAINEAGAAAGVAAAGKGTGQAMNLLSTDQLIGTTVRDRQGQEIGEVRDVMINFEKGRAGFARISSRDGKDHMVPLTVLTPGPEGGFVTLNTDRSLIETSPLPRQGMTEEQYGRALYEHYGLSYPWED